MDGRKQPRDRVPLCQCRLGPNASLCGGIGTPAGRGHPGGRLARGDRVAPGDEHGSDRVRARRRRAQPGLCRKPGESRWKRDGVHQLRIRDDREVGRAAQGGRARSCPGRADVQSRDGSLWARFFALIGDHGPFLRGEGRRRARSRSRRHRRHHGRVRAKRRGRPHRSARCLHRRSSREDRHTRRAPARAGCLRLPLLYRRGRPDVLRCGQRRHISARRFLCRSHPERRETGGASGTGAHKVPTDHQPPGRQDAWPDNSRVVPAARRRGNRMRRRQVIALIGGAAVAWPLAARGQQAGKMPRIGILNNGSAALYSRTNPFFEGLRELGYKEGENLAIEFRFADWELNRLPDLAAELVALKVDVIVAGATPAARAAKQATSTIPIVALSMGDPVNDELVASLGSPGGNVTGTTFLGPELVAKRFGLLKAALPGVSRVAALWHPGAYGERTMKGFLTEIEIAARSLGVQLQLVQALGPEDFDSAFSAMASGHADALIVLPSPMLYAEHRRIVELAAKNRLPAMYQAREFVDAGGLMAYGANLPDLARRAATYVDKILKGAKPADLPVEQPTKFELLVNLMTASEPGLTISREFLLLADEVIE